MKINVIAVVVVSGLLAACGPGGSPKPPENAPAAAPVAVPAGPEYDSTGVIAAIDGQTLTLDHDGASAAQLAAGRTNFTSYADVLAEAPLAPGARVTFMFRKVGGGYELTDLKAR
jgi:hypothetical protein